MMNYLHPLRLAQVCKLSLVELLIIDHPSHFDFLRASNGFRVPDFYKFSGDDNKSNMEHVSLFLAQMDEASTLDFLNALHPHHLPPTPAVACSPPAHAQLATSEACTRLGPPGHLESP
jgi:hypothetical protein